MAGVLVYLYSSRYIVQWQIHFANAGVLYNGSSSCTMANILVQWHVIFNSDTSLCETVVMYVFPGMIMLLTITFVMYLSKILFCVMIIELHLWLLFLCCYLFRLFPKYLSMLLYFLRYILFLLKLNWFCATFRIYALTRCIYMFWRTCLYINVCLYVCVCVCVCKMYSLCIY